MSRTIILAVLLVGMLGCALAAPRAPAPNPKPRESLEDRLLRAVSQRNVPVLKALLERGVSPNAPNSFRTPPLTEAVSRGQDALETVRLLLEHGARVDAADVQGRTALMAASNSYIEAFGAYGSGQDGMVRIIELLLTHGADVNQRTPAGETALDGAMRLGGGHARIVRALLNHGARPPEPRSGQAGLTPLHCAAYANDTPRLRSLLAAGALVNARDDLGRTPLILASEEASVETLTALLDAGADVNARDTAGNSALTTALSNEAPDAALLLVRRGADPNVPDAQKDTPLHLAFRLSDMPRGLDSVPNSVAEAQARKIDGLIEALVRAGADLNAVNGDGRTALMDAIELPAFRGSEGRDWVRMFLARGADPNRRGPHAAPALFLTRSAERKDLQVPQLLIEHGADVNAPNGSKVSLLLAALTAQDFALAGLVLEHGAEVDARDEGRKTALHWAAYYGRLDLVRILLVRGADPNAVDVLGQTPLVLARKGKHPEEAAVLVQHGARLPQAPPAPRNAAGQLVLTLPLKSAGKPAPGKTAAYTLDRHGDTAVLFVAARPGGAAQQVRFGAAFTNPAVWTPAEWNEVRYELGRGYYNAESYEFSGVVTSRRQTYAGVRWFSPAASDQHQVVHMVFRLELKPGRVELVLIRKEGPCGYAGSPLPRLSRSPTGDLLLQNGEGTFRYVPPATWKQTAARKPASPQP